MAAKLDEITDKDMAVNIIFHQKVYNRTKFARFVNHASGQCFLCEQALSPAEKFLCSACCNDLPLNQHACKTCSMPINHGEVCTYCINTSKVHLNSALCIFRYAYPINILIQLMKFRSHPELSGFFAQALEKKIKKTAVDLPQCIIAVPLHSSRLRLRGYNQSLLLSRHLSRLLTVPINHHAIIKSLDTPAQSGLSADQRRKNLKGVFAVNKNTLRGINHVAVVDDVITTGTTVNEIAKQLKKSGVHKIDVWACARAIG